MITRCCKVITYILTVALIAGNLVLNSARSHWLLRGHMISNNETVSRQNLWAREQCKKIKTSESNNFQLHNTSVKTGPSGNSKFCFPGDQCLLLLWSLLIETENLNWQPRWLPPRKRIHQNLGRGMWDFFPLCREWEIMTTQIRVLAAKAI